MLQYNSKRLFNADHRIRGLSRSICHAVDVSMAFEESKKTNNVYKKLSMSMCRDNRTFLLKSLAMSVVMMFSMLVTMGMVFTVMLLVVMAVAMVMTLVSELPTLRKVMMMTGVLTMIFLCGMTGFKLEKTTLHIIIMNTE